MGSPRASVAGIVIDEKGSPLANATITLPSLDRVAQADRDGRFVLRNLPGGPVLVETSHVGYVTSTLEIDPTGSADEELTIKLRQRAVWGGTITVTGSPTAVDPLTSPQDIRSVGGSQLMVKEIAALGKVLESLPGVSNISTGSQAGKPVIRGLSGNRIRVMKDGVPMEHYQFSFRHQPVLNVSQAERVEVVQGAASILYGSNALGGAVNVITKSLPTSGYSPAHLNGVLKSQYFTNNQEWAGGIELEGTSGLIGYRAGFTRRRADNFSTAEAPTFSETNTPGDPKFTGELPFTNFDQYSGFALIGVSGSFGNVQAIYDRYDSEQNYLLGGGKPIGQNLENDNVKLKGNILLGPKVNLKPTLSFQRSVRQAAPGASYEDNPDWSVDLVRSVYEIKLDVAHTNIAGLDGTVGLDVNVQHQNTRASGLLPDASIVDIGLFAFEERSRNKLTLNGGVRYDYREHKSEANAGILLPDTAAGETNDVLTQHYSVLSGSIGASYRITGCLTIASNFGLGFRAPDLFELHAHGVHGGVQAFQIGNPYLDPERSYSIDASLRLKTGRVMANATVYQNRIDNYIFLRNQDRDTTIGGTTLAILKADQTDGTIIGLELSATVDALDWLRLDGAYSAMTSDNKATDEELPLMPADRFLGGLRLSAPNWGVVGSPYVEFHVKHVMSKKSAGTYEPFSQFDQVPFGTASTDDYTVFSVSVGGTVFLNGQHVSVHLEVENLFDEVYVDFLDTYKGYALSMGRNVSLRIQVPLRLL